jgi:hypothetical protein
VDVWVTDVDWEAKNLREKILGFREYLWVRCMRRERSDPGLGQREMNRHLTVFRDVDDLCMPNTSGAEDSQG